MPFKSEKQRRLCWYLYNKDIKAGRKPKWDCREWEKETKKLGRPLPIKKKSKKRSQKKSKKGSKKKSKKRSKKRSKGRYKRKRSKNR